MERVNIAIVMRNQFLQAGVESLFCARLFTNGIKAKIYGRRTPTSYSGAGQAGVHKFLSYPSFCRAILFLSLFRLYFSILEHKKTFLKFIALGSRKYYAQRQRGGDQIRSRFGYRKKK